MNDLLLNYRNKLYKQYLECDCEYKQSKYAKICSIHISVLNSIKEDKNLRYDEMCNLLKQWSYNFCGAPLE